MLQSSRDVADNVIESHPTRFKISQLLSSMWEHKLKYDYAMLGESQQQLDLSHNANCCISWDLMRAIDAVKETIADVSSVSPSSERMRVTLFSALHCYYIIYHLITSPCCLGQILITVPLNRLISPSQCPPCRSFRSRWVTSWVLLLSPGKKQRSWPLRGA